MVKLSTELFSLFFFLLLLLFFLLLLLLVLIGRKGSFSVRSDILCTIKPTLTLAETTANYISELVCSKSLINSFINDGDIVCYFVLIIYFE